VTGIHSCSLAKETKEISLNILFSEIPLNSNLRPLKILPSNNRSRFGGLEASALVPGSSGPGPRPSRGYCVLGALFSQSVSPPANLILGWPCAGLASHPGGSGNTPSRFMLLKPTYKIYREAYIMLCKAFFNAFFSFRKKDTHISVVALIVKVFIFMLC